MALKWRGKGDACMLSTIHDHEMKTVHDRKGTTKEKLKVVCVEYDVMGGGGKVDLSYIL
jgi:hypothetical protein